MPPGSGVCEATGVFEMQSGGAGGQRLVELKADEILPARKDARLHRLVCAFEPGRFDRQVACVEPDDGRRLPDFQCDADRGAETLLARIDGEFGGVMPGLHSVGQPEHTRHGNLGESAAGVKKCQEREHDCDETGQHVREARKSREYSLSSAVARPQKKATAGPSPLSKLDQAQRNWYRSPILKKRPIAPLWSIGL